MVLRSHGVDVATRELRDLVSTGRDGASAHGIVTAATHFGFSGQGLWCPAAELDRLGPGAILHWDDNHFVVLVGRRRGGRWSILDPALGERVLTDAQIAQTYSGVAICVTPAEDRTIPPRSAGSRRLRERLAPYLPFLRGSGRWATATVLCATLVQVFALVHPLILQHVVDRLTVDDDPAGVGSTLLLVIVALAAGFALASAGRLLALLVVQRHIDFRLTLGVVRHLISLPYSFLARRANGDIAMRLRSTVALREILSTSAVSALLDGSLMLGYLAVLATVDIWFSLLTLALIVVQVVVVAGTWRRLSRMAAESLAAQTRSQERLFEIVSGLELLKVTGAGRATVDQWSERLRAEVESEARVHRTSGLVETVLATVRFTAPLVLLAIGLHRVETGALSLGEMLAIAALAAAVTVPVGELLTTACSLTTVASYLERLDDLLLTEPEPRGLPSPPPGAASSPELNGVTYRYSDLLDPALRDVSLRIEPGEMVAVVGPSGSGKSTLAMVLATLYRPAQGAIRFGGVDAAAYDAEALRKRLGVVTQTTTLFAGSIRANIALGLDGAEPDVAAAATVASIHDDIVALPSGYDTVLGNNGAGLSGGQRQRIAIARAVAATPELLILDEATSALDSVTEARVQAALADLGCTRVVVAHRLSTIARADRVVVMDAGRIVAVGDHAEIRRDPVVRQLLGGDGASALQ